MDTFSNLELEEMFLDDIDVSYDKVKLVNQEFDVGLLLEAVPWYKEKLFREWKFDNAERIAQHFRRLR